MSADSPHHQPSATPHSIQNPSFEERLRAFLNQHRGHLKGVVESTLASLEQADVTPTDLDETLTPLIQLDGGVVKLIERLRETLLLLNEGLVFSEDEDLNSALKPLTMFEVEGQLTMLSLLASSEGLPFPDTECEDMHAEIKRALLLDSGIVTNKRRRALIKYLREVVESKRSKESRGGRNGNGRKKSTRRPREDELNVLTAENVIIFWDNGPDKKGSDLEKIEYFIACTCQALGMNDRETGELLETLKNKMAVKKRNRRFSEAKRKMALLLDLNPDSYFITKAMRGENSCQKAVVDKINALFQVNQDEDINETSEEGGGDDYEGIAGRLKFYRNYDSDNDY